MAPHRRLTDVGRVMRAAEEASPVDAVDAVARELAEAFGAVAVSFLIIEKSGRALVRLSHAPLSDDPEVVSSPRSHEGCRDEEGPSTVVPLDGGPAEQAIRTQTVQVLPSQHSDSHPDRPLWRVLAPVTERGESIGLLELFLPVDPDHHVLTELAQVAHLLAFVVIANRRHTDVFERGQRDQEFSLSAEIQQRLLPQARTCEATSFTLAGWLEPAASIGGDSYDYSLERNWLHLSLTDAMGHGVDAALTASVCLAGLRGARRTGMTLREQASATNRALVEHAGDRDDFVAGVLGRVDLRTGELELINAGHAAPYLARDDAVTALDLPAGLPLGMFSDTEYTSTHLALEPGDRVVFVTDGMLERNVAALDIGASIQEASELHPREVVRALADSALAAAGHQLQDDATVMCLDWHGNHAGTRDSISGADLRRASDPLPT